MGIEFEEEDNQEQIEYQAALLANCTKQLRCQSVERTFFLKAYKKERYLDMRLTAIRGYAAFASEEEVAVLMSKMLEILKKHPESTPYNYQEYEISGQLF